MSFDHRARRAEHVEAHPHGEHTEMVPGRHSAAAELEAADASMFGEPQGDGGDALEGANVWETFGPDGWEPLGEESATSAASDHDVEAIDEHAEVGRLALKDPGPHPHHQHEASHHGHPGEKPVAHEAKAAKRPPVGRDIRLVKSSSLDALKNTPAWASAEALYNNPKTFVIIDGPKDTVPDGWTSKTAMYFTSYADFSHAVASGQLPAGLSGVLYNAEYWLRTPGAEKQNPERYAKKFKILAHRLGLTFIAAPAPMGRSKIFDASARNADVLVLQGQENQSHPSTYRHEVDAAARRARHMNHDVRTVSQIAASPNRVTPGRHGAASKGSLKRSASDVVGKGAPKTDGFILWMGDSSDAVHENGERLTNMIAARNRHKG